MSKDADKKKDQARRKEALREGKETRGRDPVRGRLKGGAEKEMRAEHIYAPCFAFFPEKKKK